MAKKSKRPIWLIRRLADLRDQRRYYHTCMGQVSNPAKYRNLQKECAREYARLRGWTKEED